jgi:hypothetical protein
LGGGCGENGRIEAEEKVCLVEENKGRAFFMQLPKKGIGFCNRVLIQDVTGKEEGGGDASPWHYL